MSFFDFLYNKKESSEHDEVLEQSVIVHFDYGIQDLDSLYELREKLERIIERDNLGDYDGHEMAVDYSDGFLYLYGPSAENLFKGIQSTLEQTDFMRGAKVKLRFGPPEDDVQEITFNIKS